MYIAKQFMREIGLLRALLFILIAALILSAPLALLETHKSGWLMLPTLIAPTIVPMLVFIVPLDMTMCAIQMTSKGQAQRKRYVRIIWYDAVSLGLLLLAWLPFLWKLLSVSI